MDEIKQLAKTFLEQRKLKPKSRAGSEALLALYIGYYKTVDALPPLAVICFMTGRYNELIAE